MPQFPPLVAGIRAPFQPAAVVQQRIPRQASMCAHQLILKPIVAVAPRPKGQGLERRRFFSRSAERQSTKKERLYLSDARSV